MLMMIISIDFFFFKADFFPVNKEVKLLRDRFLMMAVKKKSKYLR